jgi:hypothetical protein
MKHIGQMAMRSRVWEIRGTKTEISKNLKFRFDLGMTRLRRDVRTVAFTYLFNWYDGGTDGMRWDE